MTSIYTLAEHVENVNATIRATPFRVAYLSPLDQSLNIVDNEHPRVTNRLYLLDGKLIMMGDAKWHVWDEHSNEFHCHTFSNIYAAVDHLFQYRFRQQQG